MTARTPQQVIEAQVGALMVQLASLVAQVEQLTEENETLKRAASLENEVARR